MKRYVLNVNENVISYMERLHYEYEICMDNVAFILANYKDNEGLMDSPLFKCYQDKQLAAKVAYENAKQEFTEKFVPKIFDGHQVSWEIDFRLKRVFLTQICDCDIDVSCVPGLGEY